MRDDAILEKCREFWKELTPAQRITIYVLGMARMGRDPHPDVTENVMEYIETMDDSDNLPMGFAHQLADFLDKNPGFKAINIIRELLTKGRLPFVIG